MTRWKITQLKKPLLARNTKLFTVWGPPWRSSETSKVPVVVLTVAVYCLVVSMVMGGAEVYFWLVGRGRVLGEAGQPALTATAFACACSWASLPLAATVVLVTLDCEATLLLLPETRKTMPTITPATTTTMTTLRICSRRFCRWASAASRASLAAR